MCECVTMVLSMFWDAVCVRLQVVMHPARCTWIVSSVHRAHLCVTVAIHNVVIMRACVVHAIMCRMRT